MRVPYIVTGSNTGWPLKLHHWKLIEREFSGSKLLQHVAGVVSVNWSEAGQEMVYALQLPGVEGSWKPVTGKILGQFATVEQVNSTTYLCARDALGVAKMFYCVDANGRLQFSDRFNQLFHFRQPIYSLPRGKLVEIGENGLRRVVSDLQSVDGVEDVPEGVDFFTSHRFDHFRQMVSSRLNRVFSLLRLLEDSGYTIYVALSGGLDSSIIASFAAATLKSATAVTLDLGNSEDARKSKQIASFLGIKHLVFVSSSRDILDALERAPILCQDYRDFNVHCAALNILLAENTRNLASNQGVAEGKRIIVTGDLMNEFTCDYEEERIDDAVYYRLPRVRAKMLQRQLIGGLDTSDREGLVFRSFGLSCVQPYAAVSDLYESLPASVFSHDHVKSMLNGHLVDSEILKLIPRSKLRAQVGDKVSMGVLGLCHAHQIKEDDFLRCLLNHDMERKAMLPMMMGRYETEPFET